MKENLQIRDFPINTYVSTSNFLNAPYNWISIFFSTGQGMVEMWSTIPYNASLVDAVDMVVSPRHIKHVKDYLSCSGMTPLVVEDNLQRAIEAENEVNPEDQEGEVSFLDLTRKGCKL